MLGFSGESVESAKYPRISWSVSAGFAALLIKPRHIMKRRSLIPFSILVPILAVLAIPGPSVQTSVPVAFYHADGNGNDETGQHNATVPVTDVNNPGLNYTTGKIGRAFNFTG